MSRSDLTLEERIEHLERQVFEVDHTDEFERRLQMLVLAQKMRSRDGLPRPTSEEVIQCARDLLAFCQERDG